MIRGGERDAPAPGFLEGVRHLCDEHGAVLIFDEMITGFRGTPVARGALWRDTGLEHVRQGDGQRVFAVAALVAVES